MVDRTNSHNQINNHTIINLRTDLTEFDGSIEAITRNWNCQNFTELLNCTKVNYILLINRLL
jgi:hypothetical protein